MKQALLVTAAVVVLVATGFSHGLRTDRWGTAQVVVDAARRLDAVPDKVGDWVSKPFEIDVKHLEIGQIAGYRARTYTHQPTGNEISVLLVCGRPGAIGAHTPDVCYGTTGYRFTEEPAVRTVKVGSETAGLWHTVASKPEAQAEHLQLLWAFSIDGTWQAAKNPRMDYVRSPFLYKLYVIRRLANPKAAQEPGDPAMLFLETALPQIKSALGPS
jgi:hypothetical protein